MPPPRLPAAGHAAALTVILATMACAWLPVGGRADIPGGGGSIRRGGDKAEGAPAEERDAESAAKCAAEAAQFAAKAGLRRALLAYDADVEGRRMVYRAEPACAWAVADALAGLDEGTLARFWGSLQQPVRPAIQAWTTVPIIPEKMEPFTRVESPHNIPLHAPEAVFSAVRELLSPAAP